MMIDPSNYPALLAVVFAVLFVSTFITLLGVRRQITVQDGLLLRMSDLLKETDARLRDVQASTDQADDSVVKELGALCDQLQRVSHERNAPRALPVTPAFAEATTLARQGADAEQIVSHCQMAKGEAELLVRLHRQRRGLAIEGV
ncbi:MAG: DUF2802 domain-containing protein [Pseudomonadota bacterium]